MSDPVNKNLLALVGNHNADDRKRTVVLEGGTRSAKTWSIIEYLDSVMLQEGGLVIGAFRNDQVTCRDSIIADNDKFLGMKGWESAIHWQEGKMRHRCLATGSFIRYGGTKEPQKLHGPAMDICWLNEAMEISYEAYVQLRNRTTGLMIIDFNPSFRDHWLFKTVLQDVPPIECRSFDFENVIYVHSTFRDNPHLSPGQVADIMSMEPTEENIKNGTADQWHWEVYGLGLRGKIEGAVYPNICLWDGPWPERTACVLHGYAIDFGGVHPTVVLEMSYWNNEIWVKELAHSPGMVVAESTSDPNVASIEGVLKAHGVGPSERIVCDAAATQSIMQLRAAGYNAVPGIKGDVLDGIRGVQRHRMNFQSVSSMKTFAEVQQYRYSRNSHGYFREVPDKVDDHAPDAIRYWVNTEIGVGNPTMKRLKGPRAPRSATGKLRGIG